jgi:molybdopterin-biosynthesis enzyme MoeA-like protein
MPEGATVLQNPHGTAPAALWRQWQGRHFDAGSAREMMPMSTARCANTWGFCGRSAGFPQRAPVRGGGVHGEDRLRDLMVHSTNPTVAPYASRRS